MPALISLTFQGIILRLKRLLLRFIVDKEKDCHEVARLVSGPKGGGLFQQQCIVIKTFVFLYALLTYFAIVLMLYACLCSKSPIIKPSAQKFKIPILLVQ